MIASDAWDPRAPGRFHGCEDAGGAEPEPVVYRDVPVLTLRQVDEWNGLPKGTAFRMFRAREGELEEGRDFFLIRRGEEPELAEQWRAAGTIYPSTVHVVLLGTRAVERMRAEWHARTHSPDCGCPG